MKVAITTLLLALLLSGGVAYEVAHTQSVPAPAPLAGSAAGPIDQTNYHCWAGVCHFYGSKPITQATSTACAIQSPAATSTLGSFGARIDNASSTATNWFSGTGPTQFATTSALGSGITVVTGGGQSFLQGSTSPAAGSNTVLAPNTWVIIKNNLGITAGDNTGLGFVPTGTCYASFTSPQY